MHYIRIVLWCAVFFCPMLCDAVLCYGTVHILLCWVLCCKLGWSSLLSCVQLCFVVYAVLYCDTMWCVKQHVIGFTGLYYKVVFCCAKLIEWSVISRTVYLYVTTPPYIYMCYSCEHRYMPDYNLIRAIKSTETFYKLHSRQPSCRDNGLQKISDYGTAAWKWID